MVFSTAIDAGLDRLERLLIRQEIEALNTEFAFRVDHRHGEGVAELFVEDGVYGRANGGPRSVGREAIRASYAARRAHGQRVARHVFTNLRLTFVTPDLVTGWTIQTLFAEDGPPPHPADVLAVSDFEDVYERQADGCWLYRSRTIHSQFKAVERPVVLPLGEDARGAA